MDKFLYLIRQYLAASFRRLASQNWENNTMTDDCLAILEATPLNPTDNKLPNGMRYHMIDIYVDELDKVDEDRQGVMPLEKLLTPLRHLMEKSPTKVVRTRVREALDDERLKDWQDTESKEGKDRKDENEQDEDDDEEWGGIKD